MKLISKATFTLKNFKNIFKHNCDELAVKTVRRYILTFLKLFILI